MSKQNASTATATATATETTPSGKAKRGSTKQARAISWFQEAYAEAVKNAGSISEALLERGAELAKEFTSVASKPLSVQLVDIEALVASFYAEAAADPAILQSRMNELQELFIKKDRLEKRIKKATETPAG